MKINTAVIKAAIAEKGLTQRETAENMQFVAQFGDIRALARKITKEQRREKITEGL